MSKEQVEKFQSVLRHMCNYNWELRDQEGKPLDRFEIEHIYWKMSDDPDWILFLNSKFIRSNILRPLFKLSPETFEVIIRTLIKRYFVEFEVFKKYYEENTPDVINAACGSHLPEEDEPSLTQIMVDKSWVNQYYLDLLYEILRYDDPHALSNLEEDIKYNDALYSIIESMADELNLDLFGQEAKNE